MDMPGRDPLDLMQEVEEVLQIHSSAMNWPIGTGKAFEGVVDRQTNDCIFFSKTSVGGAQRVAIARYSLSEAKEKLGSSYNSLLQELELLDSAGNPFSLEAFLAGELTPVFFASALTNFGVEPFFDAFIHLAPCPRARPVISTGGKQTLIDPVTTPFSGYVFKLQANMDRHHRDNMAFIRICSGRFERNILIKNERSGKTIRLSRPHGMLAGERTTLDVAYPGDIIGVINPSCFAIGDTISMTGGFNYQPLPQFQPEIFAKLYPKEVDKRKSFDKGIQQIAEEGAIQILKPYEGIGDLIFAAVGQLQFEVMQYRLKEEYLVETTLAPLSYQCSAWIQGDMTTFSKSSNSLLVQDREGRLMGLFSSVWEKQYTIKQNPKHTFLDVAT